MSSQLIAYQKSQGAEAPPRLSAESKQVVAVLAEISMGLGGYYASKAIVDAVITYIRTSCIDLRMWPKKEKDQPVRTLSSLLYESGVPEWLVQGIEQDDLLSRYTR